MSDKWSGPGYRVRQLWAALHAHVAPAEYTLATQLLTPDELRLFMAMSLYDQRHCLDVYATLYAAGHRDPLLLRAALIHDCGKVDAAGRPLALPWYVLITLLKRLTPPLYRAAAASGRGWLHPVRVYAEHAWRGSRLAVAAGSPPELVMIIRHYHDLTPTGRAALLQWADEQN